MAKRTPKHAATPQRRRQTSFRANYNTGYGKPPKEHQFRAGKSGNSKGRPKGTKNTATLLREILDRKIEVRGGSTARRISVREVMLTRFAEAALKGDTKSAAFLLQRYEIDEEEQPYADNASTPEEQEIIDRYMEAYLKRKGGSK